MSPEKHDIPEDPWDFERWCAASIESQGWEVTETPVTGDQGIDLLAEREGVFVVVQCKATARPAGTSAVQQAIAGMHFSTADYCCVISRNGFTPGARALAKKSGAELIDASNTPRFSQIFGFIVSESSRRGTSSDTGSRRRLQYESAPQSGEKYFVEFTGNGDEHLLTGLRSFVNQAPDTLSDTLVSFFKHDIDNQTLVGSGYLTADDISLLLMAADIAFMQDTPVDASIEAFCESRNDPDVTETMKKKPKTVRLYQIIGSNAAKAAQQKFRELEEMTSISRLSLSLFGSTQGDFSFPKVEL